MPILVTDAELQSARWLFGAYGGQRGVCITHTPISFIKFGHYVQVQREKKMLDFVRRMCPSIPLPEVYGTWTNIRADSEEINYIAMSFIPSVTLLEAWSNVILKTKALILAQLKEIIRVMRQIPVPLNAFIRAINGIRPAANSRGTNTEIDRLFCTETDLNEWLISQIHTDSMRLEWSFHVDTLRTCLQAMVERRDLRFTHEDLGMHNILVDSEKTTAIIDLEYAGWYPEYWEYLKMLQYSRDPEFRCWARECWDDDKGTPVNYDQEFAID